MNKTLVWLTFFMLLATAQPAFAKVDLVGIDPNSAIAGAIQKAFEADWHDEGAYAVTSECRFTPPEGGNGCRKITIKCNVSMASTELARLNGIFGQQYMVINLIAWDGNLHRWVSGNHILLLEKTRSGWKVDPSDSPLGKPPTPAACERFLE